MTFDALKIISATILFVYQIDNYYTMYEVNYSGRTSYVSSYFYCRIQPERLLYDADRDLLAIAKILVLSDVVL